jgi:hypothetical protein
VERSGRATRALLCRRWPLPPAGLRVRVVGSAKSPVASISDGLKKFWGRWWVAAGEWGRGSWAGVRQGRRGRRTVPQQCPRGPSQSCATPRTPGSRTI